MITVVTAPSRSGTSLTMQMLQAAGIPLVWDLLPNRTVINPRGHYELTGDSIKPFLQFADEGCAVKVMPWHLDRLPPRAYQYIVLLRDVQECRMSHEAAAVNHNWALHDTGDLEYWRNYAIDYVADYPHILVPFNQLYTEQGPSRLGRFLNLTYLQVSKMMDCVDKELRHHKVQP